MIFEMLTDLPFTIAAVQILQLCEWILSWVEVGLSEFDFSDLAVGILIYLLEKTVRGRGQPAVSRLRIKDSSRIPGRITPTLSSL